MPGPQRDTAVRFLKPIADADAIPVVQLDNRPRRIRIYPVPDGGAGLFYVGFLPMRNQDVTSATLLPWGVWTEFIVGPYQTFYCGLFTDPLATARVTVFIEHLWDGEKA